MHLTGFVMHPVVLIVMLAGIAAVHSGPTSLTISCESGTCESGNLMTITPNANFNDHTTATVSFTSNTGTPPTCSTGCTGCSTSDTSIVCALTVQNGISTTWKVAVETGESGVTAFVYGTVAPNLTSVEQAQGGGCTVQTNNAGRGVAGGFTNGQGCKTGTVLTIIGAGFDFRTPENNDISFRVPYQSIGSYITNPHLGIYCANEGTGLTVTTVSGADAILCDLIVPPATINAATIAEVYVVVAGTIPRNDNIAGSTLPFPLGAELQLMFDLTKTYTATLTESPSQSVSPTGIITCEPFPFFEGAVGSTPITWNCRLFNQNFQTCVHECDDGFTGQRQAVCFNGDWQLSTTATCTATGTNTSSCVGHCEDCGVGHQQPLHEVHEGRIIPVCMIPEEENFCNHDGTVDLRKEECDDGNTVHHDGCTDCHWDDDWESSHQCNGCEDGYRTIEYGRGPGGPGAYNGHMTHDVNGTTVTLSIISPFVTNGVIAVEVEGDATNHVDKVMSQEANPWLRNATPCWDPIGPLLPDDGWTFAVYKLDPCKMIMQISFDLFSGGVPAGCDRVIDSNQEQQSVRLICGVFLKLYYGITTLVNVWPVEGISPAALAHYLQTELTVHLNTTNNQEKPPFEVALADSSLHVNQHCYLVGTATVQVPKDGMAHVNESGEHTIISNQHGYIVTYNHTNPTPSNIDLIVFDLKSVEPSNHFEENAILIVQLEGGLHISLLMQINGKCVKYEESTDLGVVHLVCRKRGTTDDQPSNVYGNHDVMDVLIPRVSDILQLDIPRVTAVFKNTENNEVTPIITKGQLINPYFDVSWEAAPSEYEGLLTIRVAILPGRYILSMKLPYLYVGNSSAHNVIGREKFATQEQEEHQENEAIAEGEYLFQVMGTTFSEVVVGGGGGGETSETSRTTTTPTEGGSDEKSATNNTTPPTAEDGGEDKSESRRTPSDDHTEHSVDVELREGMVELQKSNSVGPWVVVVGVGIVVVFMAVVVVGLVLTLHQCKKAKRKNVPNLDAISKQPDRPPLQDELQL